MDDSIHIFDDFPQNPSEMSPEKLHEKRIIMEERIFTILKARYLDKLREFWSTYTVPKTSPNSIVIVERRIHPNLEFILYNAAYFARDWTITIVCSDLNIGFIREILKHNLDAVHLIQSFVGNPEPSLGKQEYNGLLQTFGFYAALPSENLLLMEMDTYLRKPIIAEILKYDYVASPYAWDFEASGGGLSFRKRSVMMNICSIYKQLENAQDIFAYKGIKALGYSMPPFEKGVEYFCESALYEDPIGSHQWWTFFCIAEQEDDYVYNQYMRLEL